MVRNTALICEFNPLHNGHRAILSHIKEKGDTVIAIMSGNFTQRSEAAVFDKYKRASAALASGADLVLELPFPWCCGSGEFFAGGAVSIASSLGIDTVTFGSESGDVSNVIRAADVIDSDAFAAELAKTDGAKTGAAVVYDKALSAFGISLGSNDKLGCEYVRAARRIGTDMEFNTFKRMELPHLYRSATELRRMLTDGEDVSDFIPAEALACYGSECDASNEYLALILYAYFRLFKPSSPVAFGSDGGALERLVNAAAASPSAKEFFSLAATKKFTDSRLRRTALYSLLGVSEEALRADPAFTVVLASNEKGRAFLSSVRRTRTVAVLTKPSDTSTLDEAALKQYELWTRADELYTLCLKNGVPSGEYLRKSPITKF